MIDIKNYKKIKTIESFYKKDGRLFKENHLKYTKTGILITTYMYEDIGRNLLRQINTTTEKVESVLEYNSEGIVHRVSNYDLFGNIDVQYDDNGKLYKVTKNGITETYHYNNRNKISYIIISNNKEEELGRISPYIFGNTCIYKYENDEIYRIEVYDTKNNMIEEIYEDRFIKREFNKKGLSTKIDIFSSNMNI